MVRYLAIGTHTLGPIHLRRVVVLSVKVFTVLLADQHSRRSWLARASTCLWTQGTEYLQQVTQSSVSAGTWYGAFIYIFIFSGGSGHGVKISFITCRPAKHETYIIHAHCVMISPSRSIHLFLNFRVQRTVNLSTNAWNAYLSRDYVPRRVGTADTTTFSITRCAFKSVTPTAASLYVTVSLARASNYLEQVCCHWPWFVHCHYHVGGGGGGGGPIEEKISNLFKGISFSLIFRPP